MKFNEHSKLPEKGGEKKVWEILQLQNADSAYKLQSNHGCILLFNPSKIAQSSGQLLTFSWVDVLPHAIHQAHMGAARFCSLSCCLTSIPLQKNVGRGNTVIFFSQILFCVAPSPSFFMYVFFLSCLHTFLEGCHTRG